MTIYFSNFSNVDLKHQANEAAEFPNYFDGMKLQKTYESEHEDYTKSSNKDKEIFSEFFDDD